MSAEGGSAPLRHLPDPVERRRIWVRGPIQRVGFRPFVFRLAQELDIAGWVRNDETGVEIEAQGSPGNISALMARIYGEAPPAAHIECMEAQLCAAEQGDRGFTIVASNEGEETTPIGPDRALCDDCLEEMFDPANRRWRDPFIACSHCGPRYSLASSLPWDRVNTSMAAFGLCEACTEEYFAPGGRRARCETMSCPVCGPRLGLLDAYGLTVATRDPIADTLLRLLCGEVVAVKGMGGFQLLCDARNPEAVARLRERKSREDKPFALMVANIASAHHWGRLSPQELRLLAAPERPIVLADKRDSVDLELWGVAPDLPWVGLMLPSTPLHHLLFHDHAGRPAGTAWLDLPQDLVLVCTSANPGGEPPVIGNREAVRRLMGIADACLVHDQEILARCDDSVLRVMPATRTSAQTWQFVRRSRGYAPHPLRLAHKGAPVMAFGAHLKNALCMIRGDEAFFSQHVGDLDHAISCQAHDDAAERLMRVLAVQPAAVAHDLNEDFHCTRTALAWAERFGVPAIGVQHHHAHIGAVLAEHWHEGPVLGLAFDGVGTGLDGQSWGGELLRVDGGRFTRLAHLRALPLPGGESAQHEPWRMGAAVLHLLGRGDDIVRRFGDEISAYRMAERLAGGNAGPLTTSLGRWFDAAAALLGICRRMNFDGQAAMQLEGLASGFGPALPLHRGWRIGEDGTLDLLPLLAALADERLPARGAAVFHATLAAALEAWVLAAAEREGLYTVALSGGCFLNRVLSSGLVRRLSSRGIEVLEARQAPPNDGGIALGQAWVARHLADL